MMHPQRLLRGAFATWKSGQGLAVSGLLHFVRDDESISLGGV